MNIKSMLTSFLALLIIQGCSISKIPPPLSNSEDIIVFQNVNLVPMTDVNLVKDQTVMIKGSRIFKIGSSDTIEVPVNSKRIDGAGAYLMPGLADMHIHTGMNLFGDLLQALCRKHESISIYQKYPLYISI
jgi:hypothetical protein